MFVVGRALLSGLLVVIVIFLCCVFIVAWCLIGYLVCLLVCC